MTPIMNYTVLWKFRIFFEPESNRMTPTNRTNSEPEFEQNYRNRIRNMEFGIDSEQS